MFIILQMQYFVHSGFRGVLVHSEDWDYLSTPPPRHRFSNIEKIIVTHFFHTRILYIMYQDSIYHVSTITLLSRPDQCNHPCARCQRQSALIWSCWPLYTYPWKYSSSHSCAFPRGSWQWQWSKVGLYQFFALLELNNILY